uniref:Uncharacterized protein n=1 Tax=Ditylenchus dipsaci TaxID=166011 RepID=A0A915DQ54_9BILA
MVESSEKVASEIMATELFCVLVAITKLGDSERKGSQEQAQRALNAAEKWALSEQQTVSFMNARTNYRLCQRIKISGITCIPKVQDVTINPTHVE